MARSSGTFVDGHIVTKETCEKISKSKLGSVPWNKGKKGLQVGWNKGKKTGPNGLKGIPKSKEIRERISIACIGRKLSDATRKKISEGHKGKRLSEITKQKMRKPKSVVMRKRLSSTLKGKPKSAEHCKKMSDGQKRMHLEDPSLRVAMSVRQRKRFEDPEAHIISSLSKYDLWYGGVKHYDTPQYCEKWTESLRGRVRAFFGYQCVSCGIPQNGKKLHVHHVNYNKNTCCDDQPRLLVALCNSCHVATNNNKEYWEKVYTEIIENYYEGKCFLTVDEMSELNPVPDRFNYIDTYIAYQRFSNDTP